MTTEQLTRTTQTAVTVHDLQLITIEHQPRERAVQCAGCGAGNQWQAQHGYCDRCITRGLLRTTCGCREGVLAAQAEKERGTDA